jgi:putative ABC transport system permease protein
MDTLLQDLRYALRSLRRTPVVTATAILILSIGIGVALAMFTAFEAVLVRPLPVLEPDQIVLPRTVDARGTDVPLWVRDLGTLEQLRRETRTMQSVGGEAHQGAFATALLDGDRPLALKAAWVTGNFFELLGARPTLGRLFRAEDEGCMCVGGSEPSVLVLSYDTWQRHFAGDSGVLGHQLTNPYTLRRYTIIGVAPGGFAYPVGAEYWFPWVYGSGLNILGRLVPGATPAAASEEFRALMSRMEQHQAGPSLIAGARAQTFTEAVLGDVGPRLRVLMAAALLLLLIACVNVGNLLLLRASARAHEIAIRRSLGASAIDVARHLLVECGALAAAGGGFGLLLAGWLVALLLSLATPELTRSDDIGLAESPVGAAVAITLFVVVLIGVLPVLAVVRGNLGSPLRSDWRSGGATRGRRRWRQWLVASQAALALVMLTGAGLLTHSLEKLLRVDLGYRAEGLSFLWVVPGHSGARFADLLDKVPPALRAVPGVTALTPVVVSPFLGPQVFTGTWEVEGQSSATADHNVMVPIEAGGPEYFRTFEIPLLRGRGFLDTDRENTPRVAVVSEAAARLFWPGRDPVGKRFRSAGEMGGDKGWRVVVGIAGDIRFRRLRQPTPTIYLPSRQYFFQGMIAVRTTVPITGLLPAIRLAVHDAAPEANVVRVETMQDLLAAQRALPVLSTVVLAGFGLVALLLAAIGIYGLMAASVRERTRELGVRAALGASPERLRREVLGQALAVSGAGAVVGLGASLATTRLLASLLFEVSPTDPVALLGACGLLLAVAAVAAFAPARSATRVDPMVALRNE